jgi:hypothetical protein
MQVRLISIKDTAHDRIVGDPIGGLQETLESVGSDEQLMLRLQAVTQAEYEMLAELGFEPDRSLEAARSGAPRKVQRTSG